MFKKKDYDQIINAHKQDLIDSYVLQYGEQYRDLITERINNIKFCFYISPETAITTQVMGVHYYNLYAIELLSKLGLKDITCENGHIRIDSPDTLEEAKKLLSLLYSNRITNRMTSPSYNLISIDLFSEFKQHKKEDFNEETIKYLEEKTNNSIDEIIKLANYYSRKAKSIHALEDTFRYDRAISKIIDSNNISELILNDFNIDDYENRNRITKVLTNNFLLGACGLELKKTGGYDTVVYLSPYIRDYGSVDVFLDHEIRHAIEIFDPVNDRFKCGLEYRRLSDNGVPREKPTIVNEIMTQKMSRESTSNRQNKGIFIFQDKKVVGVTPISGYDKLVSTFDLLVSKDLYKELVDARLNPTIPKYLKGEIKRIDKELLEAEKIKQYRK